MGVGVGGDVLLLRWYSQPSAEREVPALAGLSQSDAQTLWRRWGLRRCGKTRFTPFRNAWRCGGAASACREFSQSGAENFVDDLPHHATRERVGIEEGQDAKLAERILSTRGFEVELKEEPNKLLAGKVLRVTHRGETVLPEARYPKGTKLQLVVGVAGAKDVRVPWLVGLSLKDAKGILSRRNLALGHVGYGEDVQSALDSSLAVVVSQDVSPGTQPYVEEGTAIDLYFGKH